MGKIKNLSLILGGCALVLAVAVFATMAGAAYGNANFGSVSVNWSGSASVYSAIGADSPVGVLVAALIVYIIGFLAVCGSVVMTWLKNKYASYVSLGACLLLVVAGILYFCAATGDFSGASLGVGSVLSGLFCILSGLLAGAIGVLAILKK